jgi:hypothetical protein
MSGPTEHSEPTEPLVHEAEIADDGASVPVQPAATPSAPDRGPRGFAAIGRWRGIGWLSLGFGIGLIVDWFFLLSHLDAGPKSEWVSGVGALAAVAVALWQTYKLQRQAKADAVESARRLRQELASARTLHKAEMRGQRELASSQAEAQQHLAHVQRMHLLEQQQKRALIELARAVYDYGFTFADLEEDVKDAWKNTDQRQRVEALRSIARDQGVACQKVALECDNTEMIVEDQQILAVVHGRLRDAVEAAQLKAEQVRTAAQEGLLYDATARNGAFGQLHNVQATMYRAIGEAQRLARELLRTGYDV